MIVFFLSFSVWFTWSLRFSQFPAILWWWSLIRKPVSPTGQRRLLLVKSDTVETTGRMDPAWHSTIQIPPSKLNAAHSIWPLFLLSFRSLTSPPKNIYYLPFALKLWAALNRFGRRKEECQKKNGPTSSVFLVRSRAPTHRQHLHTVPPVIGYLFIQVIKQRENLFKNSHGYANRKVRFAVSVIVEIGNGSLGIPCMMTLGHIRETRPKHLTHRWINMCCRLNAMHLSTGPGDTNCRPPHGEI